MIRFIVPGNPIPWQRAQSFGKRRFSSPEMTKAKQWIQMHARQARARWTDQPVHLTCRFYRESAHACDLDNLAKLVSDALNGIAWKDDRQIVQLTAVKAIDRAHPRTEIEIRAADEEPERVMPASIEDDLGRRLA